jgi:hypothetical protein
MKSDDTVSRPSQKAAEEHFAILVGGIGWRVGAFSDLIGEATRAPLGAYMRQNLRSQARLVRDDPRNWCVRPIALGEGRDRGFARFYGPLAWHKAARNLAGRRLLIKHGISVPPCFGCGFVTLDRRPYFVIVESEVIGCSLKVAALQPSHARDFGAALARLHGTRYSAAAAGIYRRFFTVRMRIGDLTASPLLPGVDAHLVATICRESQRLRDRDFLGPVGFTHGDINPHHFLCAEQGDSPNRHQFTWLDLDDIGVLPLRLSLASAEMRLFYSDPALIVAFNEAYFARYPKQLALWRAYRWQWYRYYSTKRLMHSAWRVHKGIMTIEEWHKRMAFVWAENEIPERHQHDDSVAVMIHELANARLKQMDRNRRDTMTQPEPIPVIDSGAS